MMRIDNDKVKITEYSSKPDVIWRDSDCFDILDFKCFYERVLIFPHTLFIKGYGK